LKHKRDTTSFLIALGVDAPALHVHLPQHEVGEPYFPRPLAFRWLAHQRSYTYMHDPATPYSLDTFVSDFQAEAFQWFATFASVSDVEQQSPTLRGIT
jgi:hypothetical protein